MELFAQTGGRAYLILDLFWRFASRFRDRDFEAFRRLPVLCSQRVEFEISSLGLVNGQSLSSFRMQHSPRLIKRDSVDI
jgi:hypothetical protein